MTQTETSPPPVYLTEAQASVRLAELEAKYDLFRFTVDGYSAWQLLRFKAAMLLQTLPFLQTSTRFARWSHLGKMLAQSIRDIPTLLFPQPVSYVVKTFSSALVEKESGKWKDVYFDYLFKAAGNCFKIEGRNNPLFVERRKRALIPISITTDAIDLLKGLLAKTHFPNGISSVAAQIAGHLHEEPALNSLTSQNIARSLAYFYWAKRIYYWLLLRIRPEILLVADTGDYAMRAAAKELGIRTVELQHGVFSRNHPDALPKLASSYRTHLIIPDKLLLYGEYWKRELDCNKFYTDELCVVGNCRVDSYRRVRSIHKKDKQKGTPHCLVCTTQGLAVEQLIEFLSQFIELADGRLNYRLYVKLHPIYDWDRTQYDAAFGKKEVVQVVSGADDPSTFDLLTVADLHLSISSACHYDAIGLGVATAILQLPSHETVLPLVDAGHASLIRSPQDLLKLVEILPELKVSPDVSAFYFRPNALDNINRELGLER